MAEEKGLKFVGKDPSDNALPVNVDKYGNIDTGVRNKVLYEDMTFNHVIQPGETWESDIFDLQNSNSVTLLLRFPTTSEYSLEVRGRSEGELLLFPINIGKKSDRGVFEVIQSPFPKASFHVTNEGSDPLEISRIMLTGSNIESKNEIRQLIDLFQKKNVKLHSGEYQTSASSVMNVGFDFEKYVYFYVRFKVDSVHDAEVNVRWNDDGPTSGLWADHTIIDVESENKTLFVTEYIQCRGSEVEFRIRNRSGDEHTYGIEIFGVR